MYLTTGKDTKDGDTWVSRIGRGKMGCLEKVRLDFR
jgi:hypothetical protein